MSDISTTKPSTRLIDRWYLRPLDGVWESLTPTQQTAVRRQAWVGLAQTAVLVIAIVQSLFAGVLRALPPDVRASLGFLHRIEWGVYAGIGLILLQVWFGWRDTLLLTNRLWLLAWPFGKSRLVRNTMARRVQWLYLVLALVMVGAALYVRAHGFIFQNLPPTP